MEIRHCGTRNHIDLWNRRVLPDGLGPVSFGVVLRGSLVPIILWLAVGAFMGLVVSPVAVVVEGGLFLALFVLGFALRRRAGHSTGCSLRGSLGGVFDKSMVGF